MMFRSQSLMQLGIVKRPAAPSGGGGREVRRASGRPRRGACLHCIAGGPRCEALKALPKDTRNCSRLAVGSQQQASLKP